MREPWPTLEPDAPEMRRMLEAVGERVVAYVESLPEQPASECGDREALARSLMEPMPEQGRPLEELLDLIFGRAVRESFNAAGPGYLAYVPGGGLFTSALADLIAAALNRYVGVWYAAPGLVQLEANVLRWLSSIVGYPSGALGYLSTGGSMANFSALVTARRERLSAELGRATLYVSEQTHHSIAKAAMLAGVPESGVRAVPTDDHYRICPRALTRAIAADRRDGAAPFAVVASAGTTNTGAVDPLGELAELCRRERLWLHVDAAYGGFFMLTERGRAALEGLERADSVTLDPHKGLFVPYGTGALLVRDGEALRRAHSLSADYMPPMQDSHEFVDFCQLSPELSRGFRGLRVWLPIALYGIDAFRRCLDEKLDLTARASSELAAMDDVEIVAEPQLSVVAFRLAPSGRSPEALDELNRRWLERTNARARVFLTPTVLGGRFVLRICVLSFRTHADRVEMALEDLRQAREELIG